MRCFTHHDQEAVGVCRACGKGLCPDCAVDLGHSISCRGACEQAVKEKQALLVLNRKNLNFGKRYRYFFSALLIFLGIIMGGSGLTQRNMFNWATAYGAVTIVLGIFLYMMERRMFKTTDRSQP